MILPEVCICIFRDFPEILEINNLRIVYKYMYNEL